MLRLSSDSADNYRIWGEMSDYIYDAMEMNGKLTKLQQSLEMMEGNIDQAQIYSDTRTKLRNLFNINFSLFATPPIFFQNFQILFNQRNTALRTIIKTMIINPKLEIYKIYKDTFQISVHNYHDILQDTEKSRCPNFCQDFTIGLKSDKCLELFLPKVKNLASEMLFFKHDLMKLNSTVLRIYRQHDRLFLERVKAYIPEMAQTQALGKVCLDSSFAEIEKKYINNTISEIQLRDLCRMKIKNYRLNPKELENSMTKFNNFLWKCVVKNNTDSANLHRISDEIYRFDENFQKFMFYFEEIWVPGTGLGAIAEIGKLVDEVSFSYSARSSICIKFWPFLVLILLEIML